MARVETLLEIVSRDVKEMKDAQALQIREIQAQKMDRTEFNRLNSEYLQHQVDMEGEITDLQKAQVNLAKVIDIALAQLRVWKFIGGGAWSIILAALVYYFFTK